MGHTYASVKVHGKGMSKSKAVDLLVDTGSTYTWINKTTLRNLNIVSEDKLKFKTIEGKSVEREIGEAVIEYDGLKATTIVVFALGKDAEVLGVHALEGLRLEVDPVTKKLKKAEVMLAV